MDKEEFDKEIDEKLAKMKVDAHHKLRGSRVFCVACGAGTRTPLRRWHNSYICSECWKIMKAIGEEKFIQRIKERTENK